jgi:hypothetical protein
MNLRETARKAAAAAAWHPFEDHVGMIVPVYGHEEEMLPLKRFAPKDYEPLSDEEELNILTKSNTSMARAILAHGMRPRAVEKFYRELERYAQVLFGMLTSGQVNVYCDNAVNHQYERISSAAWIRDEFYVLPRTGDVFEATGNLFRGNAGMKLRWRAVEFRRDRAVALAPLPLTALTQTAPKKSAPKEEALVEEILAKRLSRDMGLKVVFSQLSPELQKRFATADAGAKATGRAFERIKLRSTSENIVPIRKRRGPQK